MKFVKKFYRQQSSFEYADAYGWRGVYTRKIMRFVKNVLIKDLEDKMFFFGIKCNKIC